MIPIGTAMANEQAAALTAATQELERLKKQVRALLEKVADKGVCRACKAEVYWVRHLNSGKQVPYDATALNHFASCPFADEFRQQKHIGDLGNAR